MYKLTFWRVTARDAAHELKSVRIKSINEIQPLTLPHKHPKGTDAILLERTDSRHKGKYDKLVWANYEGKHCEVLPAVEYSYPKPSR